MRHVTQGQLSQCCRSLRAFLYMSPDRLTIAPEWVDAPLQRAIQARPLIDGYAWRKINVGPEIRRGFLEHRKGFGGDLWRNRFQSLEPGKVFGRKELELGKVGKQDLFGLRVI